MANELDQDQYNAAVFEDGGSLMIDMTNIEETSFENVPKGIYNAEVDQCTFEISKNSGQPMLSWVFAISEGEYAGRKLFFYTSFSAKALSSTKSNLMKIAPDLFAGQFNPQVIADQGLALGKPVRIKVTHQLYEGEQRARVQSILPPAAQGAQGGDGFFPG